MYYYTIFMEEVFAVQPLFSNNNFTRFTDTYVRNNLVFAFKGLITGKQASFGWVIGNKTEKNILI